VGAIVSRLTDLIAQLKVKDSQLALDLEKEIKVLSSRLPFGLNFERHSPELVQLPGKRIRKNDKVQILNERGSLKKTNPQIWIVKNIINHKMAVLESIGLDEIQHNQCSIDDLVCVIQFRDKIYPGLVSTGKVQNGADKPFHTVINGENYHVLKALTFTHRGKVDVVYIDPPYNSGAKDWKYNNDYVGEEDIYRHSKWLAMMERRLLIAKELLNPNSSVLVVTIDEKEYLRLGMLLEQTFPAAEVQMISSVINPKGTGRTTYFSRTDEYLFYVFFGNATVPDKSGSSDEREVRWRYLRRTDIESKRGTVKGGVSQFYPIYVNNHTHKIEKIGDPLTPDIPIETVESLPNCTTVFPIRDEDGMEMNWGLVGRSLKSALDKGFVRVSHNPSSIYQPYVFSYLTAPNIRKLDEKVLETRGQRPDGSWIVVDPSGKSSRPTTQWREASHEAGAYGTSLIRNMLPGRKFPFPKSLYAVEDSISLFIKDKKDAVVLDFFSGSGTTAHAVMRLNKQDGGSRQCISVTNNEVSAEEQKQLIEQNLRPGDIDWEKWGICEYITKPRIKAAITGLTPEGNPIQGEYKFNDEFSMSDGLKENAEFFTLSYESALAVSHNIAFKQIAPLLWMRAGSRGRRIDEIPSTGWDIADTYGLLVNIDLSEDFSQEIKKRPDIQITYIVTDDERVFQSIAKKLPKHIERVRLYESYLNNFSFTNGDN
jgi:adenine-specific DNA-methyltransferase